MADLQGARRHGGGASPRAARLSLRAVFSAQEGRAAARRERASLFVEPAVSENRSAAPLPAGVSAAWGMRCLRQDGQTCQAQRSHPQFPIGQDRLKRMRRGYGADEKIKDVMGQLLAVVAHSAGIQDGAGARALPIRLFMRFERGPFCGWQLHGQSPGRGPRASYPPQLHPLWRCPFQACGHRRPQAAASEAGCRPVKDIRNRSKFEGAK